MNTVQIHKVLMSSIPDCFVGVFSCDNLPKQIKTFPSALVANTQPSTKSGEHWVAFYFISPSQAEYFCSYGRPPTVSAFKQLLRGYNWANNQKRVQGNFSSVCGQYCIYYLLKRCKGLSMAEITHQFSDNYEENDELIKCYINDTFDLDTMQYDVDYLSQQICVALLK